VEKGKNFPKKNFTKNYVIMSTSLLFIGGTGSNWNCDLVNWLTFSFPFCLASRLKSLSITAHLL